MRCRIRSAILSSVLLCAALPAMAQSTSLTLDRAYDLARRGSEAVHLRELVLQRSRLMVDEAASAALPHLDLQASFSYLANPPQGYNVHAGDLGSFTPTIPADAIFAGSPPIPLGVFTIPPKDFTIGAQQHDYIALSASFSQPLFTWGKIRGAMELAGLQADAAGIALTAQRRDIDREVHRAYYGAVLATASEEVLRRLRNTAAEIAADRKKAFDEGTTNREAVLQAQTVVASLEAKLSDAEQGGLTALEGLGILTGLDPSAIVLATDFSETLPPLDEQVLLEAARTASTDLAASRTTLQQAQKKLDIEKGGSILHPDVSLGVSFGATGQEDIPFSSWNWNNGEWRWDLVISVGMKMSVFDGLASLSRIRQAERDVEMAGTGATQAEKLLRLSVRKAVDAAARADADAAQKQASSLYAKERLKNAQASFDNGMASRADLRGAEILEGSAALDLLLARYTREEARADIARLAGEPR